MHQAAMRGSMNVKLPLNPNQVSPTFLTFLHHAHTQTLLKAAVLAAVASPLVHRTVLAGQTHILGVFLHSALQTEETGKPIISHQTQSST